jgi:inner membrane transporter RhtA
VPLAASAILGVAVAYSLTFTATRLTSSHVVGTLLSADPAVGAIVGAVVLHQALTGSVVTGIILVVLSGGAVTWLAGRKG